MLFEGIIGGRTRRKGRGRGGFARGLSFVAILKGGGMGIDGQAQGLRRPPSLPVGLARRCRFFFSKVGQSGREQSPKLFFLFETKQKKNAHKTVNRSLNYECLGKGVVICSIQTTG